MIFIVFINVLKTFDDADYQGANHDYHDSQRLLDITLSPITYHIQTIYLLRGKRRSRNYQSRETSSEN